MFNNLSQQVGKHLSGQAKGREQGQGLVEYALILVLVAVVVIVVLIQLGGGVADTFQQVTDILNGGGTCSTSEVSISGNVAAGDSVSHMVDIGEGQTITISIPAENGFDPTVGLYTESGGSVGYDDDGGVGYSSLLTSSITTAGTYEIRVSGFAGDAGSYNGTYSCTE